jgi:DNA-binding GntR family transcriptional regulator
MAATSPHRPLNGTEPKRRAADVAYDAIERMISTLQLTPGTPVVEAELAERAGIGRTPVREALLRMVSIGLIEQQPRRGLIVSSIDLGDHLDVLSTRRALEALIAGCSARRANAAQRKDIVHCAEKMVKAAARDDLTGYMKADHELDQVNHAASQNRAAVNCVVPLIVKCRRFWYAYRDDGDIGEGANAHLKLAEGIATGDEARAVAGANQLMDYLERFARRVIDN